MLALALALRRSTVLADTHRPRTRPSPIVRVGEWGSDYEWADQAPAQVSTIRARTRAMSRVAGVVVDQPWVVVTTKMSRQDQDAKQAIPVGSVVRFTIQHGLRAVDDEREMAILRGRVVATRSTLLPDSYAVQTTEMVEVHDVDPGTSLPLTGQVFLVAPQSVASVESIGSEPTTTFVAPFPTEVTDKLAQPTESTPPPGWAPPSLGDAIGALASLFKKKTLVAETGPGPAPVIDPSSAAGTDSLATGPAEQSDAAIVIAIGVLLVAGVGLLAWRLS